MIFDKFRAKKKENFEICSPVKGDVIDVTKTNDPLFKSEGLGKGVGIIAEENTLVSPVNGEIKTFSLLNMLLVLLLTMVLIFSFM